MPEKGKCNRFRNFRSFAKKCSRNCTKTPDTDRFLQYVISGPKEKRGNETCYQSEATQQVSAEKTLQNGHHEKSVKSCSKRRLEYKSGFKRRILPHRNSQNTSSISSFLLQGQSLSVQSSLFRADCGTKGIYKSDGSNSIISSKTGYQASNIPRRLVSTKQTKTTTAVRPSNTPQSPLRTRFHCEQKEIVSRTTTISDIHRGSILFKTGESISNDRQSIWSEAIGTKTFTMSMYSKRLPGTTRENSIMHRPYPQCTVVYETDSDPFITELESNKNATKSPNTIYTHSNSTSSVVVTGSEHSKGSLLSTSSIQCCSNHRCKQFMGLGWPCERQNGTRSVVSSSTTPAHKLLRDGGSVFVGKTTSSLPESQICTSTIRQYDCSTVHQQAGGNQITQPLSAELGSVDVGFREQYTLEGRTYCRIKKYPSRFPEQTQGERDRMVSGQISCAKNISSMGTTSDGFICNNGKQENTSVLHMGTPLPGICNGCTLNCVAGNVCVCISSAKTCATSTVSYDSVSLYSYTDSTELATTTLVSSSATDVDSMSITTTTAVKLTVTREGDDLTPRPADTKSDCMAHINRRLETEGFSEKSRKLLAASWRKGTQKDYRSKFRLFCSWCSEQQIDPYTASLKDCVNFLTFKFHQGSAYRTIAGYRSMMSSVLPPVDKFPIGQHPYVIRLLRGVFNERPPIKKLLPEWDLPLVLGSLKKAPFEPLKDAPLKYLTWKTCFLIAITSFRRCSDLQSLRLGEGSVNVQKKGITFIRHGLSKQDRPNHVPTPIFIPYLPGNKKLDPKRCLAVYLKRTETFRTNSGTDIPQLFLSTKNPHQPVSSQTISSWIVNTIKFAYKESNKPIERVKGHSTRSVGPSWALFKGVSMKNIMESADWSKETTFVKHYLKAVNIDFLNG